MELADLDTQGCNRLIYREEVRDLFAVPDDYHLAHCISADFGMGRGIVLEFNKRFNMKAILQTKYPNFLTEHWSGKECGACILEGRVLNLITKERYFHKPTLGTMRCALNSMRSVCINNNVQKIAMPIIGCGLDRLNWDQVSELIQEIFSDTDIEILVCKTE